MEIDLDELLDLEDETCREKWLKVSLLIMSIVGNPFYVYPLI